MYKIIGADGREYGPVSPQQVRQWMTEGRLNAQTLAQAEGNPDWKPLVNFPELAPGAAPQPVAPPFPPYSRTKPPGADKKIAAGICGVLLGTLGVHKFVLGYTSEGVIMLLVTLLTCGIGGFVMWIIGLVEGITYLTKSDEDFVATYIQNKKGWF
jgi:TM2 domain-containing membrane protein YozV